MKNLILLAVGVWFGAGVAQAQYEPLVEQKLSSLSQLEMRVQQSAELSAVDKAWASQRITDNRSLLIQTLEGPLEALQQIEQQINQTNQAIAQRILAGKKAKLMGRIAMLDTMIDQYKTEGLDTTKLENLSEQMKEQVAGLMQ